MRDHDHGHPVLSELNHHIQHFLDHLRIKRRSGLIKEHDFGLHAETAGNGHTLLLPARKLPRIFGRLLGNMNTVEVSHCELGGIAFRKPAGFHWGQGQIIDHTEMGKEVELLKDHPDILSDLGQFFYVLGKLVAAHPYLAVIMLFQTVDTADHGRFA